MSEEGRGGGIALLSDQRGYIVEVIREDIGVGDRAAVGRFLADFVDQDSVAKVAGFLETLRSRGVVFDWELSVQVTGLTVLLHFAGAVTDDRLLIIGARSPDDVERLFGQFICIRNEQANVLRAVLKDRAAPAAALEDSGHALYDELSRLNNDLVNLQRELAKKNAELERVRFSIDQVDDSVLWVGSDGYFIDVNNAACRNLGYSRDELLSMCVADVDPNFPREVWDSHWADMTRQGTMIIESIHRSKTGRTFPVHLLVQNMQFRGRRYNFVIARDITERLQAEESLRRYADILQVLHKIDQAILAARSAEEIAESGLRFVRELVPSTRASVAMFNPETDQATVLAVHRADDSRVGPGMRFSTQVFGEDIETLARGDILAVGDLQRRSPTSPLLNALQADGVRSSINVPLIAQGELMGTLNLGADTPGAFAPEHLDVAREVADQLAIGIQQARLYEQVRLHASVLEQQIEERTAELRASETRFRTLFEQAAVGIALIDAEGRLIETNPALQEMLGYTADRLRGRGFSKLVQCSEDPSVIDEYEDLIAGRRERYRAEGRCTRKGGELAWVNLTASLVRGGGGEPRFAIFMVEDITEQKQTQAALLQAERLAVAGRLVASLTHEINNPLQSVIGFLGLAEETLAEGGDVGRYLHVALEELRRVARIVGQLRDLFRRPEQGDREPIYVNELLDRVLILSQRKCEESGIEVIWKRDVDLDAIPLVRDQIQQVFLNLVLNAVEAMPEGGQLRVEVASTQDPSGVRIAFADDGVGIASDKLRRIFDPFYSTKPEGLGMGLFTSQEIVEQHGGHIEVVSQSGHGATFTVWLPA